uniref:Uncharacterized protein n=1 Tax=Nelumbo nucifera TaxID=4432 RepID=A0A822ZPL7_NELNU|nr:TPA_asm: hypothetical protein HUJ06_003701 [Nelumbo nucifera]
MPAESLKTKPIEAFLRFRNPLSTFALAEPVALEELSNLRGKF